MLERSIIVAALIIIGCLNLPSVTMLFQSAVEQAAAQVPPPRKADLPDLRIRQYQFVPGNDKGLRVQIVNYGQSASEPCRLELTVRKIKDTPVGRTMYQSIPAIRGGVDDKWVTVDAKGILPKDVSLTDTTFKLIVDATKRVTESDEDNNETWHNLQ